MTFYFSDRSALPLPNQKSSLRVQHGLVRFGTKLAITVAQSSQRAWDAPPLVTVALLTNIACMSPIQLNKLCGLVLGLLCDVVSCGCTND